MVMKYKFYGIDINITRKEALNSGVAENVILS